MAINKKKIKGLRIFTFIWLTNLAPIKENTKEKNAVIPRTNLNDQSKSQSTIHRKRL